MTALLPENEFFLKYQRNSIQTIIDHQVTFIEKSRRIGETWAVSFYADILSAAAESGMDTFYIGYNHDMSREFVDYCGEHARLMERVAGEVQESFWKDPEKSENDIKVFRIDFASGHKILTLPSRPRALRGMQGFVIIDEAAFHEDLQALITAALALTMWGGKVVVISTHDGEANAFNDYIYKIRAGKLPYALLRITLDDALEDGLYKKICEKLGEDWTQAKQEKWRAELVAFYDINADEELFCIPSEGSGSYLSLSLIEARSEPAIPVIRWQQDNAFTLLADHLRIRETDEFLRDNLVSVLDEMDKETPVAVGVDFARSGDLTVFWFLEILPDTTRKTAFVIELRNIPFEQQRQILHFCLGKLPCFRAVKLDARGNGQYLAEVTVQHYGERAEAVMLSENWYRETMPPMKAAFEDATLIIPRDRELQDDLRALKQIRGVARVPDVRTQGQSGKRHGDGAIALCLAYQASKEDPVLYEYTSVIPDYLQAENNSLSDIEREIERDLSGSRRDDSGIRGSLV